jgi:hypothetical protein
VRTVERHEQVLADRPDLGDRLARRRDRADGPRDLADHELTTEERGSQSGGGPVEGVALGHG